MPRKTTKAMNKLLDQHDRSMEHFSNVISAKERGDEAPFYREHSKDYYIGLIEGRSMALEEQLMPSNCYHGFYYVDRLMRPVTPDHEDYREWRRLYYRKN